MEQRQELLARINQTGRKLSKGQKRIAEYIVTHYDKAAFMTASRLGEKVEVSESTVVRFAIALGYDGYPSLQKALQEMIRNRLTAVQRVEMTGDLSEIAALSTVLRADMQNIRQTIEDVDEQVFLDAIEAISSAKRVYIVGVRSSGPLAQFLGYYMNFILRDVSVITSGVSDVMEQIARVGPRDLLIAISFPRYSRRTIDAMLYAREQGARVLAITDTPLSPLGQISDLCLTARSDMASFVDSLVAPLSLINALIVALSIRHKDEISAYFSKMESLWEKNQVYIGKDS
ncbi:MAG: MurR/RpiR family transcriptional regulator [Christensenellaceae bacterium]|nr:MurR/RpiR family transcriptional regulator [Christensenellaceae bacterium]